MKAAQAGKIARLDPRFDGCKLIRKYRCMPTNSDRILGLIAGIFSSAMVGFISLLIYREANGLPATEINFARGIVGLAVTLPLIWCRFAQLVQGGSVALWVRAVAGAVSVLCFSWNLQHTSVGMANMLFNISLLLLLFFGHLSGEARFTLGSMVALVIIAIGTWIYWYGVNPPLSLDVITVGVLGAAAAAIAYTAMKKATRTADPILIVWAVCSISVPVSFVTRFQDWTMPTASGWFVLILISLGMLLTQYLLALSFGWLPLPLASALIPSSIVWSVLGEAFTSGVHATPHAIVGTLTYAVGICGLTAEGNRKRATTIPEPSAA
jgi:drug/metabolite transporter (DMT)-like permease